MPMMTMIAMVMMKMIFRWRLGFLPVSVCSAQSAGSLSNLFPSAIVITISTITIIVTIVGIFSENEAFRLNPIRFSDETFNSRTFKWKGNFRRASPENQFQKPSSQKAISGDSNPISGDRPPNLKWREIVASLCLPLLVTPSKHQVAYIQTLQVHRRIMPFK